MSACIISFVDIIVFPFDGFGGVCGDDSCNALLLLFMVLWVLIIRDALQEGSADVVVCLLALWAYAFEVSSSIFCVW
jgi:hypothetical protein